MIVKNVLSAINALFKIMSIVKITKKNSNNPKISVKKLTIKKKKTFNKLCNKTTLLLLNKNKKK